MTFLAGLAVGFVAGARAGRERYEQIMKMARQAADSPAVQQFAGAAQAQAGNLAKTAKEQAANRVPGLAAKAGKVGDTLSERMGTRQSQEDGQQNGAYATTPDVPGSSENL
jgi:hypothetical protein